MPAVTFQGCHKRKVKSKVTFHRLRQFERSFDLRQPGRTALLNCFNGGGFPAFYLSFWIFGRAHDALRNDWHNSERAEFGRLLDDLFENLTFGDCLKKSDPPGQGSDGALLKSFESDTRFGGRRNSARVNPSDAIQDRDRIAWLKP